MVEEAILGREQAEWLLERYLACFITKHRDNRIVALLSLLGHDSSELARIFSMTRTGINYILANGRAKFLKEYGPELSAANISRR